jgi:hypothetical protein
MAAIGICAWIFRGWFMPLRSPAPWAGESAPVMRAADGTAGVRSRRDMDSARKSEHFRRLERALSAMNWEVMNEAVQLLDLDPTIGRVEKNQIAWAAVQDMSNWPQPLNELQAYFYGALADRVASSEPAELTSAAIDLLESGTLGPQQRAELLRVIQSGGGVLYGRWQDPAYDYATMERANRAARDFYIRNITTPVDADLQLRAMSAFANAINDDDFELLRRTLEKQKQAPPEGVLTAVELPAIFATTGRIEKHFPTLATEIAAGKRSPADVAAFNTQIHGFLDRSTEESGDGASAATRWSPKAREAVSDYLKGVEPPVQSGDYAGLNPEYKRWFSSYAFMNSGTRDERLQFITSQVGRLPLEKQLLLIEFYDADPVVKAALRADPRIDSALAIAASSASVPAAGREAAAAALARLRG